MKIIYKDFYGTYSITQRRDGTATLRCRNATTGSLDVFKKYKTVQGAKRALSMYCDGMPFEIKTIK